MGMGEDADADAALADVDDGWTVFSSRRSKQPSSRKPDLTKANMKKKPVVVATTSPAAAYVSRAASYRSALLASANAPLAQLHR